MRRTHELADLLADTPAVRNARLHLVDGTLITWHGTRLAHALRELPAVLALE
jgi:ABC-type hemin transport system substrate-binding protein